MNRSASKKDKRPTEKEAKEAITKALIECGELMGMRIINIHWANDKWDDKITKKNGSKGTTKDH